MTKNSDEFYIRSLFKLMILIQWVGILHRIFKMVNRYDHNLYNEGH